MDIGERVKGHICIIAANAIFGISIPVTKYLLRDFVSPSFLTACRIAGAFVLFWIASLFVKDVRAAPRDLFILFLCALSGIVFNQGLFVFALGITSPVDASVIMTATPFFVLIISALFLNDTVTRRKLLGIGVGASGAIWLVSGSASGAGSGSVGGDLMVLFVAFCVSIYFVISKPLTAKYGPVTILKWMFLFAALALFPFAPHAVDSEASIKAPLGFWEIAGILHVVVAGTFVAYLLLPMGIKRMRPTTVSMYIYLQPIVASVVGIAAGQDVFSLSKLLASILVFGGVYIVTTSPRTPPPASDLKCGEK